MANTLCAYPFTKSVYPKDKIMSEVMISKLVKSLSPAKSFIISKLNGAPQEIISDGYYFYLNLD